MERGQRARPSADWNMGIMPFLPPNAALGIVLRTNEADCSVMDYSIMENESLMETNPDTGTPMASSAICWNAGVSCDRPDAMGVYDNCTTIDAGLQPTSRCGGAG